jgi:hypothetical protein
MSKDTLKLISQEDWEHYSDHDLAKNNGLKATAVSYYRRAKGLPKGPRKIGSGRPPKYDLTLFSHLRDDRGNADRIGCCIGYASMLRRKFRPEDIA